MSKQLLILPRMSEKAYAASQKGTYVFEVPLIANKSQVAAAVESQYSVKVGDVRLTILKGKVKRGAVRGGRASYKGTRKDIKKAYVTLREGSIKIFEEEGKK